MQWSGNIYGFFRHSEFNSLKKGKDSWIFKSFVPYLDVKSNSFLPKSKSHIEKNLKIANICMFYMQLRARQIRYIFSESINKVIVWLKMLFN